jgi:hypothetical protein
MIEKSKLLYHRLPAPKNPKPKKNNDDPAGRPYKKTKSERGVKFFEKEKSGKGKGKTNGANIAKRKGQPKSSS